MALLHGRENPFEQSSLQGGVNQVQPQTTIPMEAHKILLPIDAVKLNKISVTYQMIDGRIETKTFIINKSIAPDRPIVIEQK